MVVLVLLLLFVLVPRVGLETLVNKVHVTNSYCVQLPGQHRCWLVGTFSCNWLQLYVILPVLMVGTALLQTCVTVAMGLLTHNLDAMVRALFLNWSTCCDWYTVCVCVTVTTVRCVESCVHGECVGLNQCSCDDGWEGSTCDERMYWVLIILYVQGARIMLYITGKQLYVQSLVKMVVNVLHLISAAVLLAGKETFVNEVGV